MPIMPKFSPNLHLHLHKFFGWKTAEAKGGSYLNHEAYKLGNTGSIKISGNQSPVLFAPNNTYILLAPPSYASWLGFNDIGSNKYNVTPLALEHVENPILEEASAVEPMLIQNSDNAKSATVLCPAHMSQELEQQSAASSGPSIANHPTLEQATCVVQMLMGMCLALMQNSALAVSNGDNAKGTAAELAPSQILEQSEQQFMPSALLGGQSIANPSLGQAAAVAQMQMLMTMLLSSMQTEKADVVATESDGQERFDDSTEDSELLSYYAVQPEGMLIAA